MTDPKEKTHRPHYLRNFFFTGLLFLFPIGVTYWVLSLLISKTQSYARPIVEELFNVFTTAQVPDLVVTLISLFLVLLFVLSVGWLTSFYLGKKVLDIIDRLMLRLPVVRSVYGGTKQIIEALSFQRTSGSFKKVVMLQYPKEHVWAIGFITNENLEGAMRLFNKPMVSVFMPSTPNPTTGFLLYYDPRDLYVLDLSVEDAVKLIVSAGLVIPPGIERKPYPISDDFKISHPQLFADSSTRMPHEPPPNNPVEVG
ncbi:DUF502 domain-containing protein [Acanthopleuribacter pedis]|uniref:DUF502 domain-containing protein n=1 Tax=Acanthopleuribacter pedis TaxID=442870 RepID=A0A8J7QCZ0_9BACT|nr:DUF502 domain-containing protein [Acanthopleuribacter pedis]MBO1321499.1 DUF502 domain-containing protein [Acanthopleuribacter pedis]